VSEGFVAPGWEPVAAAFAANFEHQHELGAACCVYLDGRPVLDVWGGIADPRSGRPWREDTVVLPFSTTKGATAICAHLLAERGALDLDAPVVAYWPEFGEHGKGGTRVRWLLSHQAGLPAIDAELTLEEVCAWEPVIRALEAQTPFWPPGERHAYHAQTYGFLVGEVVRRVTGKTLGAFFAEEVAGPLGLSAWIGTPPEVEPRVAQLVLDPPPADLESARASSLERLGVDRASLPAALALIRTAAADPLPARAANLGGAFPELVTEDGGHNARIVRAAELPASNMVADARSLARMYAATVGDVDGIRLLRHETVEAACVVQTMESALFGRPDGMDAFAGLFDVPFALGFLRPSRLVRMLGARSFGHGGMGGSFAFADPDAGIGFAYVMNRLRTDGNDLRAANLIEAVGDCLDI